MRHGKNLKVERYTRKRLRYESLRQTHDVKLKEPNVKIENNAV